MLPPSFPTAGDLLTQARAETAVGSNPIGSALQDPQLYQRLNDINEEGVAYPSSVGVLGWWFMDKETVIKTKAKTSLNGAVSSGASTLTLTSGTDFDSPSSAVSGGYIKNSKSIFDFFTYEGRSSNQLTTVSGIDEDHSTLEEVHKIYTLPSDFGWMRAVYKQNVYLKYYRMDHALRQVPAHPYYTLLYLKGTTYAGRFIVFPWNIGVLDWNIQYQRSPVNLDSYFTADTDTRSAVTMDLPIGHGRRFYIEKLKSYIYESMGEDQDRLLAEQKAKEHINALLDEYGVEEMGGDSPGIILSDW